MPEHHNLISHIHSHADELVKLLEHIGYQDSATGYRHSSSKVVFLGDFIDRGEHLCQHRKLLEMVIPMVDNGHSLVVMGNHAFNAHAFHTQHHGKPLRNHVDKNIHQYRYY